MYKINTADKGPFFSTDYIEACFTFVDFFLLYLPTLVYVVGSNSRNSFRTSLLYLLASGLWCYGSTHQLP
jgi:hypothetical protein